MRTALIAILAITLSTVAMSYQASNDQIRSEIIKDSVSTYLSTTGNCPCPYNHDKAGRLCGKRSAWSKPGGQSPICFPKDVTKEMLDKYRSDSLHNNYGTGATDSASAPASGGTEDGGVKIKP